MQTAVQDAHRVDLPSGHPDRKVPVNDRRQVYVHVFRRLDRLQQTQRRRILGIRIGQFRQFGHPEQQQITAGAQNADASRHPPTRVPDGLGGAGRGIRGGRRGGPADVAAR